MRSNAIILACLLATGSVAALVVPVDPTEAYWPNVAPADPTGSPLEIAARSGIISAAGVEALTGFNLEPTTGSSHEHSGVEVFRGPQPVYGPGGARDINFVCPSGPEIAGIPLPASSGDDPVVMGCPLRVYDTGWSFGNPDLVVNPEDHRQAAFFSLHGNPVRDGPSERSRGGLAHTTFTTQEQGLDWQDQPYEFDGGAFGEFASGAMDAEGNVYASYLWEIPQGGSGYEPVLGLYKGPSVHERGGMSDSYDYGEYLFPRDAQNIIVDAHLLQLPSHVPILEMNETPNETAPPAGEEGVGEAALDFANATEERVVAVWHETAKDWANSTTGLSGWVDVAWSHTGPRNDWTRINKTEVIGPCMDASKPAYWESKIYVACVVERGYGDRSRARVGDVDLWAIDVFDGTTELIDFTGIRGGGHPLLAINKEGYMVLSVQRDNVLEDGTFQNIEADLAFSWYGRNWEILGDIGRALRQIGDPNLPLLDADITALEVTTDDQTAIMVYKEWHDDPQEPQMPEPDENAIIQFIGNRLTDYNKYMFTFNSCEFPVASAHMELGTGVDTGNAESYQNNPGMFNDVQDGLFTVREDNGEELTYFAINDYGAMQFGAVEVFSASSGCFNPPPLTTVPPPPIPQALTLTNPFSAAVGVALAAPAAAMVVYLLTVKKRVAHFAAAEDN